VITECCKARQRPRLLGLLALILLAGCSSSPEQTWPVEGLVTVDDKPLGGGTVLFEPIDPGRSLQQRYTARGTIDAEGRYRLSTFGEYDGAVAGRHRVVVFPDQRLPDNFTGPVPEIVPRKNTLPETTDLEVEVEPGKTNQIEIRLYFHAASKAELK
jgi:hypothetical protein